MVNCNKLIQLEVTMSKIYWKGVELHKNSTAFALFQLKDKSKADEKKFLDHMKEVNKKYEELHFDRIPTK